MRFVLCLRNVSKVLSVLCFLVFNFYLKWKRKILYIYLKKCLNMYIEPGSFKVDSGVEEVILNGNYNLKEINNEVDVPEDLESHINCQMIYGKGNVFYRIDTENVEDLMKLFIKYTYDPCKDLEAEFDFTVKSEKVMASGTICPTKKVLFVYKNKVFVAYGRYIFGYDKDYVQFKREIEENESSSSDEENINEDLWNLDCDYVEKFNSQIKESVITNNKIVLGVPKLYGHAEYVYSFMIYDRTNGVLDAFGLYR